MDRVGWIFFWAVFGGFLIGVSSTLALVKYALGGLS